MKYLCIAAMTASGILGGVTPALADDNAISGFQKKDPSSIQLQNTFDNIGAEVHALTKDGRTSYYIDEGHPEGRAVVFIGGQGTSLEAFQLTEFARTTREELGLRIISVERNGFGESKFEPQLGYADYNNEVLAVLDSLKIDKFVIMAISGGGAYAAQLAAAVPERVISLHAGAAVSRTLPTRTAPKCTDSLEEVNKKSIKFTHSPKDWWGVPGSPVLVIPGWQTRAYADATRAFYVGGQLGDPSALSHERLLPCAENAVVDSAKITAPAYLYYGADDKAVTVDEMKQWQAALPNVVKAIVYPGEGHTVQYRHWDQIMVDMAGYDKQTVVCRGGKSMLVADADVSGTEQLGICAWSAKAAD